MVILKKCISDTLFNNFLGFKIKESKNERQKFFYYTVIDFSWCIF